MTSGQKEAFAHGFVAGMKDIQSDEYNQCACKEYHTAWFSRGYSAAKEHFDGWDNKETDIARILGLVDAYSEFHGQQNFKHPVVGSF